MYTCPLVGKHVTLSNYEKNKNVEIEEEDIWRLLVESVCLGMTKHPWLGMSGDSGPHERDRSATCLNPGLRSHDTVDAIELLDS